MIKSLEHALSADRRALLDHPLYADVKDLDALRTFMEFHMFAVWDFMSLVKRLQRDLTGGSPWLPPENAGLARMINDIVLAEESDLDRAGDPASHLELYLEGMREIGADTSLLDLVLDQIRQGIDPMVAIERLGVPQAACRFVGSTLDVAREGSTAEVLAAFLYGRESVIPDMFRRLLAALDLKAVAPGFCHYVERHIDLDEEVHAPMAKAGLETMLRGDPSLASQALDAARLALAERLALWDEVHAAITTRSVVLTTR